MPEFVVDTHFDASIAAMDEANGYRDLSEFAQGYIEAMFFTNSGNEDDDDDLSEKGVYHLTREAVFNIASDCAKFWKENRKDLKAAMRLKPGSHAFKYAKEELNEQRLGNLFWYSRQGHGVSFVDDGDSAALKRLDIAGGAFREAYVCVIGENIEHN